MKKKMKSCFKSIHGPVLLGAVILFGITACKQADDHSAGAELELINASDHNLEGTYRPIAGEPLSFYFQLNKGLRTAIIKCIAGAELLLLRDAVDDEGNKTTEIVIEGETVTHLSPQEALARVRSFRTSEDGQTVQNLITTLQERFETQTSPPLASFEGELQLLKAEGFDLSFKCTGDDAP